MANKNTVSFYLENELKKFQSPNVKAFTLQTWYNKMFPYIPMQSGILSDNVYIDSEGIHFIFLKTFLTKTGI